MKQFLVASLFLAIPMAASAGIYNTGDWSPYLTSGFGVTYTNASMHGYDMSGFTGVFSIGAGARRDRVRVGLAYQRRDTINELFSSWLTQTDASLDEQALIATVSYDIISGRWFGMYVGIGAGVNQYDFSLEYNDGYTPKYTDSGYGAIGSVSGGISLHIANLSLNLGADYNYIARPRSQTITPRVGFGLAF